MPATAARALFRFVDLFTGIAVALLGQLLEIRLGGLGVLLAAPLKPSDARPVDPVPSGFIQERGIFKIRQFLAHGAAVPADAALEVHRPAAALPPPLVFGMAARASGGIGPHLGEQDIAFRLLDPVECE